MILHDHSKTILDALKKKYEGSKQVKVDEHKKTRKIAVSMKKFPFYDKYDYGSVEEVIKALQPLVDRQYVSVVYEKEHNNQIKEVKLNVEHIEKLYQEIYQSQTPKTLLKQCKHILQENKEKIYIPWMKKFLDDELDYIERKGKLHQYAGTNEKELQERCEVLRYIQDNKLKYIRNMSIELFQDTKYFEECIQKDFLQIVRRYEPVYQQAKEEEYEMIESEIFRSLGFSMFPEIFLWKGNVIWKFKDGKILDTGISKSGFAIQDDLLDECVEVLFPKDAKFILIENKTTYYQYVEYAKENEVVIFAQGHFSPKRKQFYQLLQSFHNGPVYLWSDLDYGGLTMYHRLKTQVFHHLLPMHMDIKTWNTYQPYAKNVSDAYIEKLKKYRNKEEYTIFYEVLDAMIRAKKVLEQESIQIL